MNLSSLGRDICKVEPTLKFICKKGHVRLTPSVQSQRLNEEDHLAILAKANQCVVSVIPPKNLHSKSSKFLTYKIKNSNEEYGYVVFGLGVNGNAGLEYERRKAEEIEKYLQGESTNEIIKELEVYTGKLSIVDITKNFNTRVERPLDLYPKDVGEIISDITLQCLDKKVYVSLKNTSGKIVASHGVTNSFIQNEYGLYFEKGGNIDLLLGEALVDIPRMMQGLNDYNLKTISTFDRKNIVDIKYPENFKDLLAAAHGYGYFLIRETNEGECSVTDLTTIENLNKYIGDVISVELHYPYYLSDIKNKKCKSMNIRVFTTNHTFQFVLRNRAGNISPDTLELTKL